MYTRQFFMEKHGRYRGNATWEILDIQATNRPAPPLHPIPRNSTVPLSPQAPRTPHGSELRAFASTLSESSPTLTSPRPADRAICILTIAYDDGGSNSDAYVHPNPNQPRGIGCRTILNEKRGRVPLTDSDWARAAPPLEPVNVKPERFKFKLRLVRRKIPPPSPVGGVKFGLPATRMRSVSAWRQLRTASTEFEYTVPDSRHE